MRFTFQATVLKGRLQQCTARVYAPPGSPALAIVEGNPLGDKLRLSFRYGKEREVKEVPFDQRQFLHNTMAPGMRFEDLAVGKRWRIKSLNLFTSSVESLWATVTGSAVFRSKVSGPKSSSPWHGSTHSGSRTMGSFSSGTSPPWSTASPSSSSLSPRSFRTS